jgi:hypothetical protein
MPASEQVQGSAATTPGQERRAEAPTTSAPITTSQHDPGRVTSAAARALPRRLLQLLAAELGYRDARHLRRHWCFSCDKRTYLEHVHTDAFVPSRSRG